jgi:hypothetical protein
MQSAFPRKPHTAPSKPSRRAVVGESIGGTATLRAGRSGVQIPAGARLLFSKTLPTCSGTRLERRVQWVPGIKRPEREADHSPSSSAEVENELRCICTRRHGQI